jgi:hypothetical protein
MQPRLDLGYWPLLMLVLPLQNAMSVGQARERVSTQPTLSHSLTHSLTPAYARPAALSNRKVSGRSLTAAARDKVNRDCKSLAL